MKDIIAIILFVMVWNSPVHENHPTAIPVLLTLYIVATPSLRPSKLSCR
jgi:hypothetical protein